jgi:uncharacterized protein YkwD
MTIADLWSWLAPHRPPRPPPAATLPAWRLAPEILGPLNTYRAGNGKAPLAWDLRLAGAAAGHSWEMAARGLMTHDRLNRHSLADDLRQVAFLPPGPVAFTAAENVDEGSFSAAGALGAWVHSPPHRMNLLGPYTHVGVGTAKAEGGYDYWTMILGRVEGA